MCVQFTPGELAAFSAVTVTARGSISTATTRATPNSAPAIPSTPEPQPTSSSPVLRAGSLSISRWARPSLISCASTVERIACTDCASRKSVSAPGSPAENASERSRKSGATRLASTGEITKLSAEELLDWRTFERMRALLADVTLTFKLTPLNP